MSVSDSQTTLCRSDDDDERRRKSRMKEFAKTSAKFVSTQIGLVLLVCAYAVAGAFIFQHLESTNELEECKKSEADYVPMENDTVYKMWSISTSFRSADDKQFAVAEFHKQLQRFRDDLLALGYGGTNCTDLGPPGGIKYKWSFMGSLLFATTVFTTVGYGVIAPKTFWGRLVCIAYAVLGIPLMLLTLASIGEVMANIFRHAYVNVCCCACNCFRRRVVRPRSAGSRRPGTATAAAAAGSMGDSTETWKSRYEQQQQQHTMDGSEISRASLVDDVEDDDEDEEEEMGQQISVPLTITLGMVGGYIFMGALLFSVWEGWDWLTSAYYCFVTIATIGFGDVVPGTDSFDTTTGQLQMIGAAVYMLFGMSLMSMSFNLIQEEMVDKFRWIGEKIGLVKKEDDDDDDDEDEDDVDAVPGRGGKPGQPQQPAGGGGADGGGAAGKHPGGFAGPSGRQFLQQPPPHDKTL
jgi:hypothetical protein